MACGKTRVQIKQQNKGTDQENPEKLGYRSILPGGKIRVQIIFQKLILDQGFEGKTGVQIKLLKLILDQGFA